MKHPNRFAWSAQPFLNFMQAKSHSIHYSDDVGQRWSWTSALTGRFTSAKWCSSQQGILWGTRQIAHFLRSSIARCTTLYVWKVSCSTLVTRTFIYILLYLLLFYRCLLTSASSTFEMSQSRPRAAGILDISKIEESVWFMAYLRRCWRYAKLLTQYKSILQDLNGQHNINSSLKIRLSIHARWAVARQTWGNRILYSNSCRTFLWWTCIWIDGLWICTCCKERLVAILYPLPCTHCSCIS